MQEKKVIIVGAGIVGLSSAYFLQQRGHKVMVIDAGDGSRNCSVGNAGFFCPSHVVPLAAPGMIAQGIKWMLNAKSPFYIKPKLDWDLIRWAWLFNKASTASRVKQAAPLLNELTIKSQQLIEEIIQREKLDAGYIKSGLLMVCQSEKSLLHEIEAAEMAKAFGQPAQILSASEAAEMNPGIEMKMKGAVYFPNDSLSSPHVLTKNLKKLLTEKGVEFFENVAVDSIGAERHFVTHLTSNEQSFEADEYVFTAGISSYGLMKALGLNLRMQGGKGYSFMLTEPEVMPRVPAIFVDGKVSMSPMRDGLRFSGTMEINGLNDDINPKRIDGIIETIIRFLPTYKKEDFESLTPWSGFRPCTPDGLPFIGRPRSFSNVTIATGHAMLGLTLGPVSGEIVADIVSDEPVFTNISLLDVDRYH